MTSAFSPPSDRRAAVELLLAVLDGGFDDGMAVLDRAEATPHNDGRYELISGLVSTALDALMLAHGGPAGAREQLALVLLDPDVSA